MVTTLTVLSATASKLLSELASSTAMVMVEVCGPSIVLSSTPVTVAVCAVSQFAGVKVRVDVTVASPVSSEVSVITTLESG